MVRTDLLTGPSIKQIINWQRMCQVMAVAYYNVVDLDKNCLKCIERMRLVSGYGQTRIGLKVLNHNDEKGS